MAEIAPAENDVWRRFLARHSAAPRETAERILGGGGESPLRWLLRRRPPPGVVHAVLDAHSDAIFSSAAVRSNGRGDTALHQACALGAPAEVVRVILERDAAAASRRNADGEIPLHCAAAGGGGADDDVVAGASSSSAAAAEVARALLSVHPWGVNARDDLGCLPLHNAAVSDAGPEVARALLDAGRSDHPGGGALVENFRGKTPLSLACHVVESGGDSIPGDGGALVPLGRHGRRGWEKLVVIARAASSASDGGPILPAAAEAGPRPFRVLHAVLDLGCPDAVVLRAISEDAAAVRERDGRGDLPLHVAARGQRNGRGRRHTSAGIVRALLDPRYGFPGAARLADSGGRLPLHLAAEAGMALDRGLGPILLAAPELLEARDVQTGMYPFMLAAAGSDGCVDTVFRLLQKAPALMMGHGKDG